jgi:glycosyltransferase involved in cell wall biosynthesis
MTAAHFARVKRHDLILAAVAKLPAQQFPLVFVACGTGPLLEEARIQAHALGVTAIFPGALGVDELVAGLNAADVLVHAAEQETFGNSVAEGMACGKPVVAVSAGAVPEVVGAGGVSGWLVPPGDPAAMSEAIRQLLGDPTRRLAMGEAARQRIAGEFSLDRMAASYAAMLEGL